MYSLKVFFKMVFPISMLLWGQLSAELNYKQDVTLSSFKFEEVTREMASEFLKVAMKDPNLEVVGIRYEQQEFAKDFIGYSAIITCLVSEPDKDVFRVQMEAMKKFNIKANLPAED